MSLFSSIIDFSLLANISLNKCTSIQFHSAKSQSFIYFLGHFKSSEIKVSAKSCILLFIYQILYSFIMCFNHKICTSNIII